MINIFKLVDKDDADKPIELLEKFFEETRQASFTKLDDKALYNMLVGMIINKDAAVFIALEDEDVVGVCGGVLYPLWFSPDHKTGQEMFWYVREDKRRSKAGKKLFSSLEEWAKLSGAASFCMVALSHIHENRVGKMYESKGYIPMERSYIKEF